MAISIADFGDPRLVDAARRVAGRMERLESAMQAVATGRTVAKSAAKLDTRDRIDDFLARRAEARRESDAARAARAQVRREGRVVLERFIGPTNDLLSVEFLEQGVEAARAVVKIETMGGTTTGTGFLVAPGILLTNNHVLPDPDACLASEAIAFDEDARIRPNRPTTYLEFDPDRFFATDEDLDFSFVALRLSGNEDGQDAGWSECGWIPLLAEQGKILRGQPINLIQHPGGGEKQVVVHNSVLLDLENGCADSDFCWYTSDTERGSSGAPVFNSRWEVVALHHSSVPRTNAEGELLDLNGRKMSAERFEREPELVHWIANEGVRCSRVVRGFERATFAAPEQAALRDRIVALWGRPQARRVGFRSGWAGV